MRLIDADSLIDLVTDSTILGNGFKTAFCALVNGEPTVKMPKTGKWEITEVRQYDLAYGGRIYVPEYRCSCCGHWYESYVRGDEPKMPDDADFPKYCEQCGVRMEREE